MRGKNKSNRIAGIFDFYKIIQGRYEHGKIAMILTLMLVLYPAACGEKETAEEMPAA